MIFEQILVWKQVVVNKQSKKGGATKRRYMEKVISRLLVFRPS